MQRKIRSFQQKSVIFNKNPLSTISLIRSRVNCREIHITTPLHGTGGKVYTSLWNSIGHLHIEHIWIIK